MLIRATIENFLSFNHKTEILLTPGKSRNLKHHILKGKKTRDINILKSSIFYGANASGKSNLIKALHFAQKMITNGPKSNDSIKYDKFKLDKNSISRNSSIEIEFRYEDEFYAYGFQFNKTAIVEEWLYRINKETESKIFERKTTKDGLVELKFEGLKITKEELKRLSYIGQDTNLNELFLFSSNHRNIKNIEGVSPIINAFNWFDNILTIIFPRTKFAGMEVNIDSDKDLKEVYRWFLTEFKTGITGLETIKIDFFSKAVVLPNALKEKIANDLKIGEHVIISSFDNIRYTVFKNSEGEIEAMKLMTSHKMKNENKFTHFEINEESDGTQRIMDLIPALMELSKENKVFIIDEIERSLHPNLTYKLFELFFNESIGKSSQLICTTHEDHLLNLKLLRKDEIWFVKKNRYGESTTYSLEEFKPRKDKDIRTGYLKGRFEAIPLLASMNNAPWKN